MPFNTDLQSDSEPVSQFIENVGIRNKGTAKQCYSRLLFFESFARDYYKDKKSNDVDKLLQI
ncbi:MAG TPA: hypothetical protein VFK40_00425 [Nitrososphaeraceae archaeon]|nr:hypothetical protein [Nitrososphaeraceae archaeon]